MADDLVLGRGRVYFGPFKSGTKTPASGELYLGNTPSFTVQANASNYDRWKAFGGRKYQVGDSIVSETHSARFMTDNISVANIAMWYSTLSSIRNQSLATGQLSTFTDVVKGSYYQIGVTSDRPWGVQSISDVVVKKDGVTVSPTGNYEVDTSTGRIYFILTSSVITNGSTIHVFFRQEASTQMVVSEGAFEIEGCLRFIADNQVGPNKNYFYPCVKLANNGQIDLKGDDWQRLGFVAEARKKSPSTKLVYIYSPVTVPEIPLVTEADDPLTTDRPDPILANV